MLLLVLTATSCTTAKFKPDSPEPLLSVDAEAHDFGTIPGTETVDHIFTVTNKGAQPLDITRVQTSCGCTAAMLDNQFLKPGETTRLKVTFDPRGRRGKQSRTVYLHSNDPKTPKKQLKISATITPAPAKAPGAPKPGASPAPTPATTPSAPTKSK